MGIITLTKQPQTLDSVSAADSSAAAGAPDQTMAAAAARCILEHFSTRWGQGAPVTVGEAKDLGELIATRQRQALGQ